MSNMSYCRFQNTLSDLHDCETALIEIGGDLNELSSDEKRAARQLIALCRDIADAWSEDE